MITQFKIHNFKRFDHLEIILPENELIICGENGSGKTQILWAFLLFFRGYNLGSTAKPLQVQSEISDLLAHPALSSLPNYESFIHSMDGSYGMASFSASFRTSLNVDVTLKANGILELLTKDNQTFKSKLHFAFMGSSYHYTSKEELFENSKTPLNSSGLIMRQLYHRLSEINKRSLNEVLGDLFNTIISPVGEDSPTLSALELPDCKAIDIMFCGSALQKVAAALTLVFFLSQQPSTNSKYYLIEEPEAMLYPSVIIKFFHHLRNICAIHGIYLIGSTNSEYIYNLSCERSRLTLKRNLELADEDTLKQVLGFMRADAPADKRILLVCDGKDDQKFLEKILPPDLASNFKFNTFGNQIGKPEIVRFLHSQLEGRIVYVRDSEFKDVDSITSFEAACRPATVIHHVLPCVESYYILDALENKLLPSERLRQYFRCIQTAVNFSNGFNQHKPKFDQKKSKEDNKAMEEKHEQLKNQLWNDGLREIEKDNDWDWVKVVKLINGHHGADLLLRNSDSSSIIKQQVLFGKQTLDLINELVGKLAKFVNQSVGSEKDDSK